MRERGSAGRGANTKHYNEGVYERERGGKALVKKYKNTRYDNKCRRLSTTVIYLSTTVI